MACTEYGLSITFIATIRAICSISGVLAVVENLAVLLAVRKLRSLRSTARHFMASLAAAELLSGFIANLYLILNHSRNEEILIRTETAVWAFTTASVTFSLSNVALDRYIAITTPLKYHDRMTYTRCLILIIFSWCVALLGSSVAYVLSEENLYKMWICESIISVIIPFCIIAFCYFKIYKATRSTFPLSENITDAQQIAENNRQRKTAYTFGIITGMFMIVFMPIFFYNCFVVITSPPDFAFDNLKCHSPSRKVWICIAVVSYFSAVLDPWVYVIRMRDFRMAFKELFQSMCRILHLS